MDIPLELQGKYLLIDTCVLSDLFKHGKQLAVLFDELDKINCQPCITEFIYLEYIRIAKSNESKLEMDTLLSKFIKFPANDPDLYTRAEDIYPLYNYCAKIKNHKQVSIVDLFNVCYLSKFENKLYYITFDHGDFPPELLNRIAVGAIDVESEILTWGMYKFESARYKRLKEVYDRQV